MTTGASFVPADVTVNATVTFCVLEPLHRTCTVVAPVIKQINYN